MSNRFFGLTFRQPAFLRPQGLARFVRQTSAACRTNRNKKKGRLIQLYDFFTG